MNELHSEDWRKLGYPGEYLRMSMRCSRGRGLLVRDTSLERQVAASSWEYEDWGTENEAERERERERDRDREKVSAQKRNKR